MKFTMFIRPAGTRSAPWREQYDFPSVRNVEDAVQAAQIYVADWNARAGNKRGRRNSMIEKQRECVAIECCGVRRDLV